MMKSIKIMKPVDFMEEYTACCKEYNTKAKVHLAKNDCLVITADKLELTDWNPLLKALGSNHTLHSLKIVSTFHLNTKLPKAAYQTPVEPVFFNTKVLNNLIQTSTNMMTDSALLSSLILDGIPLSNEAIDILGKGIEGCNNLQHLALPNCMIGDFGAYSLCHLIRTHTGLKLLDMSNCRLTIEGAKHVTKMMKAQKLACFGELWKQSLRYRTPDVDLFPGLRRITLNNNSAIGDEGIKLMLHELLDDLWIKAFDIQNCGITVESKSYILDVIKTNPVIAVLDIQYNNLPTELIETVKKVLKVGNSKLDKTYDWLSETPSVTNTSKGNTSTMCNKSMNSSKVKDANIPKSFLSLNNRTVHFNSKNLRGTFVKQTKTLIINDANKNRTLQPSNSTFVKKISWENGDQKNALRNGSYMCYSHTSKIISNVQKVPYTVNGVNAKTVQKLRRENYTPQPKLIKSAMSMPVTMNSSTSKQNVATKRKDNKNSRMSFRSVCLKNTSPKKKVTSPYCVKCLGFVVPEKTLKECTSLAPKGSYDTSCKKTKKGSKKSKSKRKLK